jgi:hypothetical protein
VDDGVGFLEQRPPQIGCRCHVATMVFEPGNRRRDTIEDDRLVAERQ